MFKPAQSVLCEAVKPFKSQFKKPIKKNTRTFLQDSSLLNDTDITDNDDPIEKRHKKMIIFSKLFHHWVISQLHLTNKMILKLKICNCNSKLSWNNSICNEISTENFVFDASLFQHISKFSELFLTPDTPLKNETILKYRKEVFWDLYINGSLKF